MVFQPVLKLTIIVIYRSKRAVSSVFREIRRSRRRNLRRFSRNRAGRAAIYCVVVRYFREKSLRSQPLWRLRNRPEISTAQRRPILKSSEQRRKRKIINSPSRWSAVTRSVYVLNRFVDDFESETDSEI